MPSSISILSMITKTNTHTSLGCSENHITAANIGTTMGSKELGKLIIATEMEEELEPASPTTRYLNSSVLSLAILAVFESEIPVDDSNAVTLLGDRFLPMNHRFSSILIMDKKGDPQVEEGRSCS